MSAADPVMRIFNRIAIIIFIILNILALLIGIALIICGIIMCVVLVTTPELQPLDAMMIALEIVLFFTGGLLAVAFSVFAFVAGHTRSRVLLLAYAVIVLVIAVLELAVGIILFTHREEIFTTVENGFNITMNAYGLDLRATTSLDAFQETFQCCGVNSAEDWEGTYYYNTYSALPDTCCANLTAGKTCQIGVPNTHNEGCYTFFHWLMVYHLDMIGSFFVVAGCVQLLCVVVALWMLFYTFIQGTSKPKTETSEGSVD